MAALTRINNDWAGSERTFPLQFKKASFLRTIQELAVKIIMGFWRTAASYFGKASMTPEQKAHIDSNKWKFEHMECGMGALDELSRQSELSPAAVLTVLGELERKNQDFQVVPNFIAEHSGSDLPEAEEKGFVVVPVVLKGLEDHIVVVVYDYDNAEVQLFDPKGFTCEDYGSIEVRNLEGGITLKDVVERVTAKYGYSYQPTELVENTTKVQYDNHNCGMHVLYYALKRSEGLSHQEIVKNPLSYTDANNAQRVAFMTLLADRPAASIDQRDHKHVATNILDQPDPCGDGFEDFQ